MRLQMISLLFFFHCFLFATTIFAENLTSPSSDPHSNIHTTSDAECITCHSDDEPHEGNFGQDCSLCHTTHEWGQLGFDHGLSSFPLIGIHTEVDCYSCHQQKPGVNGTRNCQDCHREDEPHEQKMGLDCARCHNPNGWDHWQFDHGVNTSFQLEGKHASLECIACHTTPITAGIEMSQRCFNCHEKDEPHRGEFGFNCERCHQPTDFKDVKMKK